MPTVANTGPQYALLLIGPTASGKSAVGHSLSVELSWPILSFGSYIRDQAERCGIPIGRREELERLGASLIAARGCEGLLRDLLEKQDSVMRIILDGVRHVDMLQAVKRVYPEVCSIYLDVGEERRYERWLIREGLANTTTSRAAFDRIARGEVEHHVYSLIDKVDHVVDGARPVHIIVLEIRGMLSDQ